MTITVERLAQTFGLTQVGGNPGAVIYSAANIDEATSSQVTFIATACAAVKLKACAAAAVIVPRELHRPEGSPATTGLLLSDDPEIDFIRCLNLIYPQKQYPATIHPSAQIDASAIIGEGTFIDAHVTIGAKVKIGRHCRLLAGSYVDDEVEMGEGCMLYPNVVLYSGTVLLENVTIHAGTVIGSDGFGYKHRQGIHIKFPQVGVVRIERDVEIGSNTCIDRAALGETRIGAGTKIDNHVHVAHNVKIGKGVLICGQAGIGGSTVIEDYVILASQSGVADHVRVGRGAKIFAQAGVIGDVASGAEVLGFPATDRKEALRRLVTVRRIVEIYKPLKALVDLLPKLLHLVKDSK